MKAITLTILFLINSTTLSFACDELNWNAEAKKFLQKDSPEDSQIDLEKDGKQFSFNVRHKKGNSQYLRNGTLIVSSDEKGNCEVKILSSQVQTQGEDSFLSKLPTTKSHQIDLNKLAGKWTSGCIQMQDGKNQGYALESYSFDQTKIQMKRSWFKNQKCEGKVFTSQTEDGSFEVGQENTNNGFNPSGTYEVKYSMGKGIELGLLWTNSDYTELRISRGFGSSQNTMLALTQYKKSR